MSELKWDESGKRFYETGVKQGVLYPQVDGQYPIGYAWNGLLAITESPSGAEANDMYADDMKYGSIRSAEQFGGTIEAYTYPDEFMPCDGSAEVVTGVNVGQQTRQAFGLCYRTTIGNDVKGTNAGTKLHLIYNATASPSERAYQTINDSPEAITFSWEFETSPVNITNYKPTSIITIDTTKLTSISQQGALANLEKILYGVNPDPTAVPPIEGADPRLPLPNEVIEILDVNPEPEPEPMLIIPSAMDSDEVIKGALVGDLQSNIDIANEEITGTLSYFTDSESELDVPGYFIALHVETDATTVQAGIDDDLETLNSNRNGVWKITDKTTQVFKVVAEKNGIQESRTYDLSNLEMSSSYTG